MDPARQLPMGVPPIRRHRPGLGAREGRQELGHLAAPAPPQRQVAPAGRAHGALTGGRHGGQPRQQTGSGQGGERGNHRGQCTGDRLTSFPGDRLTSFPGRRRAWRAAARNEPSSGGARDTGSSSRPSPSEEASMSSRLGSSAQSAHRRADRGKQREGAPGGGGGGIRRRQHAGRLPSVGTAQLQFSAAGEEPPISLSSRRTATITA
ncbi:hypothetical protein ZWY2020_033348 [Hordeum vulgare]|nr:hypothetical protein ZWY2020_033348 [Hordeum vulgare]